MVPWHFYSLFSSLVFHCFFLSLFFCIISLFLPVPDLFLGNHFWELLHSLLGFALPVYSLLHAAFYRLLNSVDHVELRKKLYLYLERERER